MKTMHTLLLGSILALSSVQVVAQTRAEIDTNYGKIEVLLDEKKAPKTVANFVQYANKGFYQNTIFHRVINGFMIQAGGFTADMREKTTDKAISNEAHNGLKNRKGSIAMARTSNPNSATSQFFINLADNDFLNHKNTRPEGFGYAVFGQVSKGMDVVEKIARVPTKTHQQHQNVPAQAVVIKNIKIIQNK